MEGAIVKKKILDFIITYIKEHGYSPSVREIGDGVGLKSTSSVQNHLTQMIKSGMLETDAGVGVPRAIRVPGYKFVKNGLRGGGENMNNIESTYDCGICAARSFCLSACQPGSIMCMVNKTRTGQTKADEERYQTRPYRGRHIN